MPSQLKDPRKRSKSNGSTPLAPVRPHPLAPPRHICRRQPPALPRLGWVVATPSCEPLPGHDSYPNVELAFTLPYDLMYSAMYVVKGRERQPISVHA